MIPVAVLGATGMVGQHLVRLLEGHPWFEVREVTGSERSMGRAYGEAANWRLQGENPRADLRIIASEQVQSRVVFSALDKSKALEIEPLLAQRGHAVVSNASALRMHPDVPLIIPEVNPEHVEWVRGKSGFTITNPNCTCIPVTMALRPLIDTFGVQGVFCASYQAVSGAGYPGESAWDMLGDVHPHAGDEEEKMAEEPNKMLGDGSPAGIPISARCVRVPVVDGHLVAVSVKLGVDVGPEAVGEILAGFRSPVHLPSLPAVPMRLLQGRDRPTPRRDADAGNGMQVSVGRVERCALQTVKFYVLANNVIRGAAGAAIANAELLKVRGLIG